jgi:hypothetical protein
LHSAHSYILPLLLLRLGDLGRPSHSEEMSAEGPPRGAVDLRWLIVGPLLGAVGPSLLLFAPWKAVSQQFHGGGGASSVPSPAVMQEAGVLDERSHSTTLFLPCEEPGRSFRVLHSSMSLGWYEAAVAKK